MEACGIDARTRGRRMDEGLQILRELLTGRRVTFSGEIFSLADVAVHPALPSLPILVGGRSDAALQRTGRLGDGWIGIWISPERFAAAVRRVEEGAERAGREAPAWRHGITVWCGFGPDRERAARSVSDAMQSVYRLPREAFERWCPAGSPEQVADFIAPYFEAGASDVTLIARGEDIGRTIEAAAEVRRLVVAARATR